MYPSFASNQPTALAAPEDTLTSQLSAVLDEEDEEDETFDVTHSNNDFDNTGQSGFETTGQGDGHGGSADDFVDLYVCSIKRTWFILFVFLLVVLVEFLSACSFEVPCNR